MKKASILMAAVLCGGTAVGVWADELNPQPLPPGVAQASKGGVKVVKHGHAPGTNSAKTKRLLPKTHISGDGGKNLTLHDSKQLQGNMKGGNAKGSKDYSKANNAFIKFSPADGTHKAAISGNGGASQ